MTQKHANLGAEFCALDQTCSAQLQIVKESDTVRERQK